MNPLTLNTIAAIRDAVLAVDPDDGDLLFDMIEGETDAGGLMDDLLEMEAAAKADIEANKFRVVQLTERSARLAHRADAARAGMQKLLGATGLRKMDRAAATVSLRAVPPKVIAGDISNLPREFIIESYRPDLSEIKQALKEGEDLPGWALSNGGESISIRRG